MTIRKRLASGLLLIALINGRRIQAQTPITPDASASVQETLSSFLTAFDNLDWPVFRSFFADDATMFHPAAPNERRIDTPEQFEKAWLGVFARIKRQSGRAAPPYMDLQPKDLKIQLLSPDVALATFHLLDGTTLSRRTIVLKRYPAGWKIVHIHASNLTVDK
jgi:ketosteroid isomerase-like protein